MGIYIYIYIVGVVQDSHRKRVKIAVYKLAVFTKTAFETLLEQIPTINTKCHYYILECISFNNCETFMA